MPNFKKSDGFQMKRGSKPPFMYLGSSPINEDPSPVKFFGGVFQGLNKLFGGGKKREHSGVQVGEGYEGGEDYAAIQEAQNTQPYVDSSGMDKTQGELSEHEGVLGKIDIPETAERTKKSVDVEVTVNGEPV